ncbi:MAG: fructose-bisphosphate aldolase class I [Gammaproteobacteria bacterium]|nr:fructose-bisphosphate aldolase class I [Gammaproteobacteria bacterium]MYD78009.1 fructose-bisphosphate aldolase class I [Gammaproteobacteria bacterium]MYI90210.1 fructose-bisphosphate aldolase class I [Gammaproteobacteria bacterium]
MNLAKLESTAREMVSGGRGILAMDESTGTCTSRFENLGVPSTEETRLSYRSMLVTAEGLSEFISGAILFDETIRQRVNGETPFATYLNDAGIVPGIKVDTGAKALAGHPGEKVTEGLDGLRERLQEYVSLGARFAKWRAVITIGDGIPSDACLMANAHGLARYAALCQESNVVPIVEPEVLMDGEHSIEQCRDVTHRTLKTVFNQLDNQGVALSGIVLKPNMVLSGKEGADQANVEEVARQTVDCFLDCVPASVPGVAFLSGGQTDEQATQHLNKMNQLGLNLPWYLTFSYGRALQQAPMKAWSGDNSKTVQVHQEILQRAEVNALASQGQFEEAVRA